MHCRTFAFWDSREPESIGVPNGPHRTQMDEQRDLGPAARQWGANNHSVPDGFSKLGMPLTTLKQCVSPHSRLVTKDYSWALKWQTWESTVKIWIQVAPWLTKNSTSIFHRFVDLFVLHLFGDSSDSKTHCRHQWRKTKSPACHMSTLTVESWKSAWNFAWILFVHSVLQISCQWPAVDTLAEQS